MNNKRFEREILLIKEEGFNRLQQSRILVIGLGGVGSYVVESLARAGVGLIGICDFDKVDETNINRQIIALESTIGKDKVEVVSERLIDINPNLILKKYNYIFDENNFSKFDFENYDYIIDAIDMVSSKILLIRTAKSLNIPIISSMGTGNKMNPSDLYITDLAKSEMCPLAKKMRYELKKYDIKHCKILLSKEKPLVNNSKIIGSISFVPSIAGLLITSEVIKDLLNKTQY